MDRVFTGVKGAGVLDFVSAWYLKAADFVRHARESGSPATLPCAFVSTNSITQGEQVGVLWAELYRRNMHIQFAHRTFKWSNEARGKAAVHCVIIGFGIQDVASKRLFDYEKPDSEPLLVQAARINPYLVDAPETFLTRRSTPISPAAPPINYGNMPIDSGHLILNDAEREQTIAAEPAISPWIRRYYGGDEFLNGIRRWCLWLVDAPPAIIKQSPFIRGRVELCRQFRMTSGRAATKELARLPSLFGEIRHPRSDYLLIPKVSSEHRAYIPMGFLGTDVIASGTCLIIAGATRFDFGVLSSQMHMAWMRAVSGRLESRYQYSNGIVYNNFPWPELPDDSPGAALAATAPQQVAAKAAPTRSDARGAIETAVQGVLDARAQFPEATLADLYDPLTMPPVLVKAHQKLDKAVDAAYIAAEKAAGRKPTRLGTDAERVAFLFERYQALTSLLPKEKPRKARKRKESP